MPKHYYDPDLIWCDECDQAMWVHGDSDASEKQICPKCLEAKQREKGNKDDECVD